MPEMPNNVVCIGRPFMVMVLFLGLSGEFEYTFAHVGFYLGLGLCLELQIPTHSTPVHTMTIIRMTSGTGHSGVPHRVHMKAFAI